MLELYAYDAMRGTCVPWAQDADLLCWDDLIYDYQTPAVWHYLVSTTLRSRICLAHFVLHYSRPLTWG